MAPVEPQVFAAAGVLLGQQDFLLNADIEQLAGAFSAQASPKAVFGVDRITHKIGDANDSPPGPVAINVIKELDKARFQWIDQSRHCASALHIRTDSRHWASRPAHQRRREALRTARTVGGVGMPLGVSATNWLAALIRSRLTVPGTPTIITVLLSRSLSRAEMRVKSRSPVISTKVPIVGRSKTVSIISISILRSTVLCETVL